MSRSEFKGRRLRTDCLSVTPLSQSAVEAIYGMEGTLPKHAVDNLCKSHERLRAELSGAMILLAEAENSPPQQPSIDPKDVSALRCAVDDPPRDGNAPNF